MRGYEKHEMSKEMAKPAPEGLVDELAAIREGTTPVVTPPDERSRILIEQVQAAERVREREEARPITEAPVMVKLHSFAGAYPLDMFPEPTNEERAWLYKERPGLQDRIAASMARHVIKALLEEPEAQNLKTEKI